MIVTVFIFITIMDTSSVVIGQFVNISVDGIQRLNIIWLNNFSSFVLQFT